MRTYSLIRTACSGLVGLLAAVGICDVTTAQISRPSGAELARVVERTGEVTLRQQGRTRMLEQWDVLYAGDTVELAANAMARMVLPDGQLVETTGPRLLAVQPESVKGGTSLIGRISAVARVLLFGKPPTDRDRPMAVREAEDSEVKPMTIPRLLKPYDGERVIPETLEFAWEPVAGIDLYSLSLYDSGGLIWKTTTSAHRLRCPAELRTSLADSRKYFWQVEAISGGCILPSRSAGFEATDSRKADSVQAVIGELSTACTGGASRQLLAAEVLFQAGFYSSALAELRPTGQAEDDLRMLSRKARLLQLLGDDVALAQLAPAFALLLRLTPTRP